MSDLTTLKMIKDRYRESADHWAKWRKDAEEEFAFASGDQWDDRDRAILKEQGRPEITFNRIGPVLDSVAGMEVNNRQEARYIPRETSDAKVNEALQGAAKWARDNCDAEDEESDGFYDALVCGLGYTETRMDYDGNPDGVIVIDRIDPLEMYPDPRARKNNLIDARYFIRVREINIDDAKEMFPDADETDLNADWASDPGSTTPHQQKSGADAYDSDDAKRTSSEDTVRLVECQWREKRPVWRVLDPITGKIEDLTEAQYTKAKKRLGDVKGVKQYQNVYRRAFVGRVILEEGDAPCKDHFSWCAITGKRDRNNGVWYGLCRGMKDPQRWANKWLSQSLHILNTSAKGGVMAEKDATSDVRAFEKSWADSAAVTWVEPGAISSKKITEKPKADLPNALDKMMSFAIASIRDVSGVNIEMMGLADRQQSGVLENTRKQSAMTILATLFNSLRHYRKIQSRVLLYYIQNYLSDDRMVRILGPEGAQSVPLTRDMTAGEYDVVVDDTPSSPNQKEATWFIMSQILPTLMKLPLPMETWKTIIEASPLTPSVSSKLIESLTPKEQGPPPPPPEVIKAQSDIQIAQQKADASIEEARKKTDNEIEIKWKQANADIDIENYKALKAAEREKNAAIEKSNLERDVTGIDGERSELAASHEQLAASHEQLTAALSGIASMMQELAQGVASNTQATQEMQAMMMAPKHIIRDKQKRLAGIQIEGMPMRPVTRGADGLVTGLN